MKDPSDLDEMGALQDLAYKLPLSFEMFPPSSAAGHSRLVETVDRLAEVATGGFSVTMGAGGSSRQGTQETAVEIGRRTGRPVKAHLIALGHSREEALEVLGTDRGVDQAGHQPVTCHAVPIVDQYFSKAGAL